MFNLKDIFSTKSNLLSLFRLLLAVPFWFLLDNLQDPAYRVAVFSLCVFAAFTDMMDGYLARKFNEVTEAGKVIDTLADKVVVGVIIFKLFWVNEISTFYFLAIILRDIIIFTGSIIVSRKLGRVLPSNMLGKITVISISLVILLVLAQVSKTSILFSGFYYISIILIFASLIGYFIRSMEFIRQKEHESLQKS